MSPMKLVAIALLSKDHLAQGKYVVLLEIVDKKNADSIIKKRQKEGYVVDRCLMKTERSPEKEIKIPKNGEVSIKFAISGALKPKVELAPGQDKLSFKDKGDCKCILNLVRNPDDTTDTGCITLTFVSDRDETFFHRVQIDDVPFISLSASMSTMSMSSSVSSNLSDQASGDVGVNIAVTSGQASPGAQLQADPLRPRDVNPGPNVVQPVDRSSSYGNLCDGSSDLPIDEEYPGYFEVMKNTSLEALAGALDPNTASRLIIGLGVPNNVLSIARRDSPGDTVHATYNLLVRWRNSGQQDTVKAYKELVQELESIGRRDIAHKLKQKVNDGTPITRADFENF